MSGPFGVAEKALLLGPRQSMVGVLATPVGAPADAGRPVVVILNSGIVHRVGPNRLSVQMARAIAASGLAVLRFDLSGIGDSEARQDLLPPFEAALADVREALDTLARDRAGLRVVLIGLCSGADHAVFYSGQDARVAAVVLIDPTVPRTRRYYLNHYASRLVRGSSWRNVVSGQHAMWGAMKKHLAPAAAPAPEAPVAEAIDDARIRELLSGAYGRAVQAGVRMLVACTADLESRVNYREQLVEALPTVDFGASLRLEYFEQADHTFTMEAEREALLQLVVGWLSGNPWGPAPPLPFGTPPDAAPSPA